MKGISVAGVLAALALSTAGLSQEVVRNPAKPLNPDAGRALKLELAYEIKDEAGLFYFKWPLRFSLDEHGCLYVLDQDQLLKFSPAGKFIRNFYRKGQGPGEIGTNSGRVSFCDYRNCLYVYDGVRRISRIDQEGKLLGEVTQTAGQFFGLLGMCDKGYFMRGQTQIVLTGGAGFREIESTVSLLSPDGTSAEKIAGFTSRIYQGPQWGMDWDNFMQVFNPADGSLYVSRTCEYRVERYDLLNRKSAGAFTREYRRVPFVIPDDEKDFYAQVNPPKKNYANDIVALFAGDDTVWVKTSTTDKAKGALFDIFDRQGRFIDSFYLRGDLELVLARGEFIYVKSKDKDESITIRKYKVLNGPKSPPQGRH